MNDLFTIKERVKEVVTDILSVEDASITEIDDNTPFFGTDENPGIIQDSLAILEISSRLAEEFDILPSDFNEDSFQNVETLSAMILEKVQENAPVEAN
ncbi:acyl carrier protein [Spirosoma validum]|uniref:Acyl carrier protein n=1 Tax=Spirosoma validum TaxID=2771355 RepID=A0A927GDZ4_9BACT|nr:acyl carrier protein [Spirosoma validum]MBD2754075.1 acyl carrier protein [Spirosoma validum]